MTTRTFGNLLARSPALCATFDLAAIVAAAESTVLIQGETGTGKSLLAEAIHYQSRRNNHPFVMVCCSSLSRNHLESELFGQEKIPCIGSLRQRKGRLELAHKGTLFLDEIADIPPDTQVKLLHFAQTGKFERLGGHDSLQADVRILAATKKDLAKSVHGGTFRQDLYSRLKVLQIQIPPLRERSEDIPLLVEHFLKKYSPNRDLDLPAEILSILMRHRWEGNVRELEHVVERLVLLGRDGKIDRSSLPLNIVNGEAGLQIFDWGTSSLHQYLDQIEERVLKESLARCNFNKAKAAHLLGIPLPTLKSKVAKFQLSRTWDPSIPT